MPWAVYSNVHQLVMCRGASWRASSSYDEGVDLLRKDASDAYNVRRWHGRQEIWYTSSKVRLCALEAEWMVEPNMLNSGRTECAQKGSNPNSASFT